MEMHLGKNIKYLREKRNIDQQTFADILEVPRSTLACWENNLRTPKLEQIVKIAEYFGTNLDIVYVDYENNVSPIETNKTDSDYKKKLKEKGLMDENERINEEKIDDLMKVAEMMKKFNEK